MSAGQLALMHQHLLRSREDRTCASSAKDLILRHFRGAVILQFGCSGLLVRSVWCGCCRCCCCCCLFSQDVCRRVCHRCRTGKRSCETNRDDVRFGFFAAAIRSEEGARFVTARFLGAHPPPQRRKQASKRDDTVVCWLVSLSFVVVNQSIDHVLLSFLFSIQE